MAAGVSPKVFLGFFGITRSLRHTWPGIAANLIAPLQRDGFAARRFAHVHVPARISNARSGEHAVACDAAEVALLGCEAWLAEPQDEALIEAELAFCRSFADPFADDYASVRNLCFQLRSLARLWALMGPHVGADDWVLFLRPDLAYLDPLDLPAAIAAMQAGRRDIAVPDWHAWGGLNDRMALCRARAAAVYAGRAATMFEAVGRRGGLHGETLLAEAVATAGLRVGPLAMRAVRVRADGRLAGVDVETFFGAIA